MSYLLSLFLSLIIFMMSLFAINFIFLRVYRLNINFIDGFKFSIPSICFIYSGVFFDFGKNYLSEGIIIPKGKDDSIVFIVLMMIGGFFLSSIYNSQYLNKFYDIKLSYFDCFIKNFKALFFAKIVLVILAIIIGFSLAILDFFEKMWKEVKAQDISWYHYDIIR